MKEKIIREEDEWFDPCDYFEEEEEGDGSGRLVLDDELNDLWRRIVAEKRRKKISGIYGLDVDID